MKYILFNFILLKYDVFKNVIMKYIVFKVSAHHQGFVQFANENIDEMPRMYLATPDEIAKQLYKTTKGHGDTITLRKQRME